MFVRVLVAVNNVMLCVESREEKLVLGAELALTS